VDPAPADVAPAARVWRFPDTPPLATYVVVVNAGPFVELRREHAGHDLGLYARQSLARYLERDADELFDLTARGLDWFGERFGMPFPQRRYDQVFVPNMGGAMENWGCITWTDAVLFRSSPSYAQRAQRANVLLHEMAHMWFGDMVTMRWWDDLWLNEAFASWAATWASAGATEHVDAWAGTLVQAKLEGYRADMGPGTHPVRADVPDVAQAMANFDAITYAKGESVLKQLSAFVGEDAFLTGLQAYFRDHRWGSTTLDDLVDAVARAAGRDLSAWTTAWLDRSGTDTIRLVDGALELRSPDADDPRPHRLDLLSLAAHDDRLEVVATTAVETSGTRTAVDLPTADLHLLNAGDLTFAAVRPDPVSTRLLTERAGQLPDPLSRALAGTTTWDMLVKGEIGAAQVVSTLTGALAAERSPLVVEAFLALAVRAAEQWAPRARVAGLLEQVATTATGLVDDPQLRTAALRTLAASAGTPAHLEVLHEPARHDLDLAWRVLARRSELGDLDETAVRDLQESDPDPEAWVRALGVRAASADPGAKQEVWTALVEEHRVPMGQPLIQVGGLFWRPGQDELLRPFTERYLDALPGLATGGLLMAGAMIRLLFPYAVADEAFLERAGRMAQDEQAHPAVRQNLLTGTDTLRRMLAARQAG
jgi:aminopeptidase N